MRVCVATGRYAPIHRIEWYPNRSSIALRHPIHTGGRYMDDSAGAASTNDTANHSPVQMRLPPDGAANSDSAIPIQHTRQAFSETFLDECHGQRNDIGDKESESESDKSGIFQFTHFINVPKISKPDNPKQ
jgi:hypothetical protein